MNPVRRHLARVLLDESVSDEAIRRALKNCRRWLKAPAATGRPVEMITSTLPPLSRY